MKGNRGRPVLLEGIKDAFLFFFLYLSLPLSLEIKNKLVSLIRTLAKDKQEQALFNRIKSRP